VLEEQLVQLALYPRRKVARGAPPAHLIVYLGHHLG
jgi:hypothetical protein